MTSSKLTTVFRASLMPGVLPHAGRAITGVNKTIEYVPVVGSLDRFGQAMNWFFVGMMLLSGAVYFINGIRYDTVSAGASVLGGNSPLHALVLR